MSAKIVKLIVSVLSDEKLRKKIIILVLSISFGFFYLMCLPVIIISNLGTIDLHSAGIDHSIFTEENFLASLDSEQAAKLNDMMAAGGAIEVAMADHGVADQTIKAELIYLSFFDNVEDFDADVYASLFASAYDDTELIGYIYDNYRITIDYEEFFRTYTFVMNNTINPYMFTDTSTKNSEDLAAWADNAFISGWGYKPGFTGEKNSEDRLRYCDNAGLMLGYLNYDPGSKSFADTASVLTYIEQGELSTMPDVPGLGLYDGIRHGVYIGGGQVVYCDESVGYATRQAVSNGAWTSWCTYLGISYPQIVQDTIDELNSSDDSSEDNSDDSSENGNDESEV